MIICRLLLGVEINQIIQKGVIDSRDVLYFLSVIVFSLFTTGVIIRAHRAG